jgi:hypothetical protein
MDHPDYAPPEDLKHSANVLTQMLYRAAMASDMLPRKQPN